MIQRQNLLQAAMITIFTLTMLISQHSALAGLSSAQKEERKQDQKRIAQERKELRQAQAEFRKDVRAVQSGKKTAEEVGLAQSSQALGQAQQELKSAQNVQKTHAAAVRESQKNPLHELVKQDNAKIKQERKELRQAEKAFREDVRAVQSGKKTAEEVGLSESTRNLEAAQRELKAAQDSKKAHQNQVKEARKDHQNEMKENNQKIAAERKKLNEALKEFRTDSAAVSSGKKSASDVGLIASARAVEEAMARLKAAQGEKKQDLENFKKTGGLSGATLASLSKKVDQASGKVGEIGAQYAQAKAFNEQMAGEYKTALDESKIELSNANADLAAAMNAMDQAATQLAQVPSASPASENSSTSSESTVQGVSVAVVPGSQSVGATFSTSATAR